MDGSRPPGHAAVVAHASAISGCTAAAGAAVAQLPGPDDIIVARPILEKYVFPNRKSSISRDARGCGPGLGARLGEGLRSVVLALAVFYMADAVSAVCRPAHLEAPHLCHGL